VATRCRSASSAWCTSPVRAPASPPGHEPRRSQR
jgi:hypothetical protein